MTVTDVIAAVGEVRAIAHDDEAAHSREDALYERVLRAISENACADPAGCAREALKTAEISFARWGA